MLWIYEMSEDGKRSGDWPTINYRLEMFGRATKRTILVPPQNVPSGFRTQGVTEPQRVTITSPGPQHITYSVCAYGRHIHIAERFVENRREATLVGTSECNTDHAEHIARVAVRLEDLPETTQVILKKVRPNLLRRLLRCYLDL